MSFDPKLDSSDIPLSFSSSLSSSDEHDEKGIKISKTDRSEHNRIQPPKVGSLMGRFASRISRASSQIWDKIQSSTHSRTSSSFSSISSADFKGGAALANVNSATHHLLIPRNPEECKKFADVLMTIQKKSAFTEEEKLMLKIRCQDLFGQKCDAIYQLAQQKKLPSTEKLEALLRVNEQKITRIRTIGWSALKEELGRGMATEIFDKQSTFERFRGQLVDALNEVRSEILMEMGYSEVGSHSAIGTPGYNSDIDTVFIAPEGMSHTTQVCSKILFDQLCYVYLGGLPGDKLDAESYTNHGAQTLKTEEQLIRASPTARREYNRQEDALACLQQYHAYMASSPPDTAGWNSYKENEISAAPNYRNALMDKFEQVERLDHQLKVGILRQMVKDCGEPAGEELDESPLNRHAEEILRTHPNALKLAEKSYNTDKLIKLSERMDQNTEKLRNVQQQLSHTSGEEHEGLKEQEGQLLLELNIDDGLRRIHFPESYLTNGAFDVVCYSEKGQIYDRSAEGVQKYLARRSSTSKNRSTPSPMSESSSPKSDNSSSSSETGSFHPGNLKKVTTRDLLSSMQENLAMYQDHFRKKMESGDAHQALIATSKYLERTMDAATKLSRSLPDTSLMTPSQLHQQVSEAEAMQLMFSLTLQEGQVIDRGSLKRQSEILHFISKELVSCKRQNQLNYNATRAEMKSRLIPGDASTEKLNETEKVIDEILAKTDPEYGLLYSDESLIPKDRYGILLTDLFQNNLIEAPKEAEEALVINDTRLRAILMLRSGYTLADVEDTPEDKAMFIQLNNEALTATLSRFKLDTPVLIDHFIKKVESLSRQVRNAVINKSIGNVETPATPLLGFDLVERWNSL